MSFYEDRHQLRTANYPETMAALFNLAFNLIRLCRRPCLFAIGSKNDGRSDQLTAAIDNLSQLVCAEAVDDEIRRFRYNRPFPGNALAFFIARLVHARRHRQRGQLPGQGFHRGR